MRRWTAAGVGAGLAMAALVGCGNDVAGEALTRAAFTERGNEICAATEQRIHSASDAAFPGRGTAPTVEQIEAFAKNTVIPEIDKQIEELKELKPPKDDRARVNEIMSAAKKGLDKVKADATAIQSRELNPFARYDELASDYGLKTCGEASAHTRELMSGVSQH